MNVGRFLPRDMIFPCTVALCQMALQIAFHNNYGYFRDELYYIACSNHPSFGYVDQPPFSIWLLQASRLFLGDSLQAIRFLPSLAGAACVILTALTSRRLGGGAVANGIAALAVACAPVLLGHGRYFSMNAFDVFFWTLAGWIVVKILSGESPKLWLAFGLVAGFGLLNKYSMGFYCIGIFGALLLTAHRNQLARPWFWLGAGLALLVFLPHIVWEIAHDYPSLEFMRNASETKNVALTPLQFLGDQLKFINYANAAVVLLGLSWCFFDETGRRFRPLGWSFLVVLIIMLASNAKAYYLSPAYPMVFAAGGVLMERMTVRPGRSWLRWSYVAALLVTGAVALPFALPVLPVETFIAYQNALGMSQRAEEKSALGVLPQYYADQFGWKELTTEIARAYRMLTPEEQARCVIYARNYGEAGAIDFFGRNEGLPNVLCPHNSYWFWGPGDRSGDVAIIIGNSRNPETSLADLRAHFRKVEQTGTIDVGLAMPFERGRQIFLCRGFNTSFQAIWHSERFFL